jgi:hypothetical protein
MTPTDLALRVGEHVHSRLFTLSRETAEFQQRVPLHVRDAVNYELVHVDDYPSWFNIPTPYDENYNL